MRIFLTSKHGVKTHTAKIIFIVGKYFSTNVLISFKSRDFYFYTTKFEVCRLKIVY
jgi:hypothetical protein